MARAWSWGWADRTFGVQTLLAFDPLLPPGVCGCLMPLQIFYQRLPLPWQCLDGWFLAQHFQWGRLLGSDCWYLKGRKFVGIRWWIAWYDWSRQWRWQLWKMFSGFQIANCSPSWWLSGRKIDGDCGWGDDADDRFRLTCKDHQIRLSQTLLLFINLWPLKHFVFSLLFVKKIIFMPERGQIIDPLLRRMVYYFVHSCNSLVLVSDPSKAIWADMAPFKGPQSRLERRSWNYMNKRTPT